MSAELAQAVDAKELFETVEEGDQLLWDGREEPVTVYRHVTKDDARGQVISMKEMQEHHVLNLQRGGTFQIRRRDSGRFSGQLGRGQDSIRSDVH
jgi:hypothetical protein